MNAILALALKAAFATGTKPTSGNQSGNTTNQTTGNTTGANAGNDAAPFHRLLAEVFHLSPQSGNTGTKDPSTIPTTANGQPGLTTQAAADLAKGADDVKGKNSTDLDGVTANPTPAVKSQTDDKADSKTDGDTDQNPHEVVPVPRKTVADPVTKSTTHTPTTVQPTVVPITVPTPQSLPSEGTNTANGQSSTSRASTGTDNGQDPTVRVGQGASANGGKPTTHSPAPEVTAEINDAQQEDQETPGPTQLKDLAARSVSTQTTVSTTPPHILQAINKSTVNATPEKHVSTVTSSATPQVESTTQATTQVADIRAQPLTGTTATVGSTTSVSTQIADAMVSKAGFTQQGGTTDIYLHLNPPELGTVNLHLRASGDTLTARVVVSSDATRSMIEQQLPDLRARLGESGITLGGFDVAQQHQNSQQQTTEQQEIPQVDYGSPILPRTVTSQSGSSQTQRSGQLDVLV